MEYGAKGKYAIIKRASKTPNIQFIKPTAMVVEQAKSQVKQQFKAKQNLSQAKK